MSIFKSLGDAIGKGLKQAGNNFVSNLKKVAPALGSTVSGALTGGPVGAITGGVTGVAGLVKDIATKSAASPSPMTSSAVLSGPASVDSNGQIQVQKATGGTGIFSSASAQYLMNTAGNVLPMGIPQDVLNRVSKSIQTGPIVPQNPPASGGGVDMKKIGVVLGIVAAVVTIIVGLVKLFSKKK